MSGGVTLVRRLPPLVQHEQRVHRVEFRVSLEQLRYVQPPARQALLSRSGRGDGIAGQTRMELVSIGVELSVGTAALERTLENP